METKTYRVILTKEAVYYVNATSEMEAQQHVLNTTMDEDYDIMEAEAVEVES